MAANKEEEFNRSTIIQRDISNIKHSFLFNNKFVIRQSVCNELYIAYMMVALISFYITLSPSALNTIPKP